MIYRVLCFLTFIASMGLAPANAQDSVVVSGTIKNSNVDTVKIVLNENLVVRKSRTFYLPLANGQFWMAIPLNKPSYLSLSESGNYVNGMVAPGDDVNIVFDSKDLKSSLSLSGSAKEKFEWFTALVTSKLTGQIYAQAKIAKEKPYPFDYIFSYFDSVQTYYLDRLQQIKKIDSPSAHLLRSHIEGSIQHYKFASITSVFSEDVDEILAKRQQQLTPASIQQINRLFRFREEYYNSPIYINSLYNMLHVYASNLVYKKKMSESPIEKYRLVDSMLPGKLKIPVLTMFIDDEIYAKKPAEEILALMEYVYGKDNESIYKDYIVLQLARTQLFKKGMKAPDFNLENERGEKVNLASFKGKVVYLDFWFAACGPCHSLFLTTKSVKEHFRNNKDVVFLMVSIDEKELWKQALKKFQIPGYHTYTENRERRHPIISDYKVEGYPTTFLIDKSGNIFTAGPSGMPDELKSQIEEALKL